MRQSARMCAAAMRRRGICAGSRKPSFWTGTGPSTDTLAFCGISTSLSFCPAQAVRKINELGWLAVVVTNQPVIARGEVTEEQLEAIHCKMETLLGREGAWLDAIYYCPHHPDKGFPGERPELKIHCSCRKPAPGMLLDAAQRFNIDLSRSWMVGDGKNDVLAGKNAGCRTALLCADGTPPELGQERTAPSLYDFVEQVLRGKEGEEKR